MPITIYLPTKRQGPEPVVTECQECGRQWSDGRTFCDHDHCERVSPHKPEERDA